MRIFRAALALCLCSAPAFADEPPPPAAIVVPAPPPAPVVASQETNTSVQLMSLRVMRDKGILSQAEYESALKDLGDSVGGKAADSLSLVLGKFSTTVYGFVELDGIWDSTQSLTEVPGNTQIARQDVGASGYAGNNARLQMTVRNSRLGFRMRAPEYHDVRASAVFETDLVGNQPTTVSEGSFYANAGLRVRHAYLKLETPIVDLLFGQTWRLFGWQNTYHPNTVEIQGVPGEIYSRTPQIRLSKTVKTDAVTFEIAIAALRPDGRDSGMPEGEGGLRLAVNKWTSPSTGGSTGTSIQPLSIAVTGNVRQLSEAQFAAKPVNATTAMGWGVAVDAFIPIVPGTKEKMGNSLAINAEVADGMGIADVYTSLNGGFQNAPLPDATQTYAPTSGLLDSGLAVYDAKGVLHPIGWMSYLVGIQYYTPINNGRVWVSANYSHMSLQNASEVNAIADPTATNGTLGAKARSALDWFDANLFWDATPAVRFGLEYAHTQDTWVQPDKAMPPQTTGVNHRVQFSAFYLF